MVATVDPNLIPSRLRLVKVPAGRVAPPAVVLLEGQVRGTEIGRRHRGWRGAGPTSHLAHAKRAYPGVTVTYRGGEGRTFDLGRQQHRPCHAATCSWPRGAVSAGREIVREPKTQEELAVGEQWRLSALAVRKRFARVAGSHARIAREIGNADHARGACKIVNAVYKVHDEQFEFTKRLDKIIQVLLKDKCRDRNSIQIAHSGFRMVLPDNHSDQLQDDLERKLADIPFEELQKALADGSHDMHRKHAGKQHKLCRANKNRPMEISSKAQVGRFREVIQAPKRVR
ncbi:hypothetical protein KSP40_PGU019345 [Platanthera guangdongensis]|uniref:Uncharacterized protein n=1 Tax=Platanthera guangdongensis TaxID=2320717 RepID=A0ABR2LGM7_9ASPA